MSEVCRSIGLCCPSSGAAAQLWHGDGLCRACSLNTSMFLFLYRKYLPVTQDHEARCHRKGSSWDSIYRFITTAELVFRFYCDSSEPRVAHQVPQFLDNKM